MSAAGADTEHYRPGGGSVGQSAARASEELQEYQEEELYEEPQKMGVPMPTGTDMPLPSFGALGKASEFLPALTAEDKAWDDELPLPSLGSSAHGVGKCRPCYHWPAKSGCPKGRDCEFCHLTHPKRSKKRVQPHEERLVTLTMVQAVHDARWGSDADRFFAEARLLLHVSPNPRVAAYATSVMCSLRSGKVLKAVQSSV